MSRGVNNRRGVIHAREPSIVGSTDSKVCATRPSLCGEEGEEGGVGGGGLVSGEDVGGVGDSDELGASDSITYDVGVGGGDELVGFAVEDEGGSGNLREAAVALPGHDGLQLGHEAGGVRPPLAADGHVFGDALGRSGGIVDEGVEGAAVLVGIGGALREDVEDASEGDIPL